MPQTFFTLLYTEYLWTVDVLCKMTYDGVGAYKWVAQRVYTYILLYILQSVVCIA